MPICRPYAAVFGARPSPTDSRVSPSWRQHEPGRDRDTDSSSRSSRSGRSQFSSTRLSKLTKASSLPRAASAPRLQPAQKPMFSSKRIARALSQSSGDVLPATVDRARVDDDALDALAPRVRARARERCRQAIGAVVVDENHGELELCSVHARSYIGGGLRAQAARRSCRRAFSRSDSSKASRCASVLFSSDRRESTVE